MELPPEIKNLYRHWPGHLASSSSGTAAVPEELRWFIKERIEIWERKTFGAPPPYTTDPVLSQYRFCNIFRELDRQTLEIHALLNPLREDFSLWLLNIFYARMVARPSTMRTVGLLTFDKKENDRLYTRLIASPRPRYGTPYVFPVSTIQKSTTPTRERFIAEYLPSTIPRVAREIERFEHASVYEGVEKILPLFGFNHHFLWTEVLIDVAYQFPARIDLFKRFPIGPGSAPTFKKLSPDSDPSLFVEELAAENTTTSITIGDNSLRLSAENWEGVGCEYRKYTNLKSGHGRRRLFAVREK